MASTPALVTVPFATGGDVTTLPSTDANGFVNFTTGYTSDYELSLSSGNASAKAVERGVQNFLFNLATSAIAYWQANSRPAWYEGFPNGYAQYAEVIGSNGRPYRSLSANNVSDPTGNTTSWEYIEGTGEMVQNIPMPSGGSAGPGSRDISTSGANFNSYTTNGTYQFLTDAATTGAANPPANGGTACGAGMLEVSGWSDAGNNTYVVQMFRDRNGVGMLRGAYNGSWTSWKIWVNSTQYVVGEIRIWSGAATDAAVQAAYGAGWHVCNGSNSTPNLQDSFLIGSSVTRAVGSTGGAFTRVLTTAQLPAHTHAATVTDPGHAHAITDGGHNHVISDPGHAHSVYDPGHAHTLNNMVNATAGNAYPLAMTPGGGQAYATAAAATGIGIYANGTGVSAQGAVTNVKVNTNTTGITVANASVGTGTAVDTTPPYYAVVYIMYTGK